ncbi:hypothetical protein F4X33_04155 [Candidatus Poribacteria bacterium]|nr:hypothetical protein [Candidatus Poribacteria bacterium]
MRYFCIVLLIICIVSGLGCEMFSDRIFEPEPPDPHAQLEGMWGIELIDGVSLQAATEAVYADWYFSVDGDWSIYVLWDYGPIVVEAVIEGQYELDGTDIVFYIDDDYGLFGIDPGESLIKGTLHFDGDYLTFNEQGDDDMYMEIVMYRLDGYNRGGWIEPLD